tara:strand:- start:30 stop:251 length:222 start_codon:yes stop_codon:yes gene_type:complete
LIKDTIKGPEKDKNPVDHTVIENRIGFHKIIIDISIKGKEKKETKKLGIISRNIIHLTHISKTKHAKIEEKDY